MAEKKEVVDEKALQKIWIKSYLGQYYWARNKKRQLERRLQTFRQEMIGTKGMQYSPVPHSQTNSVGDGPASMVIRAMEIEEQIESQKEQMANAMLNVMKMMDFLPAESTERIILEYRHIDCLSWKQIAREMNYSIRTCRNKYDSGMEKLLGYKKVQKMIEEYSEINASQPR